MIYNVFSSKTTPLKFTLTSWRGSVHYTKHGIDHSERIAQYLGKLLEDFPTLLNQQERFVLLAAIFLHDIGNQLPKYAGIPIKLTYSIEELEKIRKNHHLSSCEVVKDSVKDSAELPLGLDICKLYTKFIADLCKYHRKLDLKYLKAKRYEYSQ